jgi:hypothetical protein
MSQRDSGYARKERDLYETPEWVTLALAPHIPRSALIHEPAAGSGKMMRAIAKAGYLVTGNDIETGTDFLQTEAAQEAIVTNPPYALAQEFIEHALKLTWSNFGFVAMLLRTDYDHAKTRQHLFSGHAAFAKKIVLTKRIQWFEDSKGQPSFNHAWFIWDWKHQGPPVLAYGP